MKKGLTSEEVAEAVRRATSSSGASSSSSSAAPAPSVSPAAPAPAAVAPTLPGGYPAPGYPAQQPPGAWQPQAQVAQAPQWQGYGRPGPGPTLPYPVPPVRWPVVSPQPSAPWWALLIGGLGLGSALATLASLLWRWLLRRSQHSPQAALPPPADGQTGQQRLGQAVSAQKSGAVLQALPANSAESTSVESHTRFEELVQQMKAHVEETQEANAALRRSLEQQQRLYQIAANDFQRKMDDAAKRKSATVQRIEIASESLHVLRSLLSVSTNGTLRPSSTDGETEAQGLRNWFSQVEASLTRLLHETPTAAEAKKTLQTASMVVHNLLTHPGQDKYREVSASSSRFKETLGGLDGAAADLLRLAGFENVDGALVFPSDRSSKEAGQLREILQDALRDCDRRWGRAHEVPELEDQQAASLAGSSGVLSPSKETVTGEGPIFTGPSEVPDTQVAPAGPSRPWAVREPASASGLNGLPVQSSAGGSSSSSAAKALPWLSSVVKQQISRLPNAASPPAASPLREGQRSEEDSPASLEGRQVEDRGILVGSSPAHPAEARSHLQEPQSGG